MNIARIPRYVGTMLLVAAAVAVTALTTTGCSKSNEIGPGESGVEFVMARDGLDWSVYCDNNFIARLDHGGASSKRELDPGSHSMTLHDNKTGRNSRPYYFSVPFATVVQLSLGAGDITIYWN